MLFSWVGNSALVGVVARLERLGGCDDIASSDVVAYKFSTLSSVFFDLALCNFFNLSRAWISWSFSCSVSSSSSSSSFSISAMRFIDGRLRPLFDGEDVGEVIICRYRSRPRGVLSKASCGDRGGHWESFPCFAGEAAASTVSNCPTKRHPAQRCDLTRSHGDTETMSSCCCSR